MRTLVLFTAILSLCLPIACGDDGGSSAGTGGSSGSDAGLFGGAAGSGTGFLGGAAGVAGSSSGGAGQGSGGQQGGSAGQTNTGGKGGSSQGAAGAVQVAAGASYSCALLADGNVKCWGDNSFGQLGTGPIIDLSHKDSPTLVPGLSGVKSLTVDWNTTCVVLDSGKARCWGHNNKGQLGNGASGESTFTPVNVVVTDIQQLALGFQFTTALTKDGKVSYWGGLSGKLDTVASKTFDDVSGMTAITAQYFGGCGLEQSGKVKCWGSGAFGGLGLSQQSNQIEYVENLDEVTSIASGRDFSCAVHQDGTVSCWGRNNGGQLGDPSFKEDRSLARKVPGISGATRVACGGYHGCAIVAGGKVKCWGDSSGNQSGNPSASTTMPVPPTEVQGLSGAVDISANYGHTCARTAEGKVYCWGLNNSGQLGSGSTAASKTPVEVDL